MTLEEAAKAFVQRFEKILKDPARPDYISELDLLQVLMIKLFGEVHQSLREIYGTWHACMIKREPAERFPGTLCDDCNSEIASRMRALVEINA